MGDWSRSDILTLVLVIIGVVGLLQIREIHDFVLGPQDESRTIKFFRLVAAFLVAMVLWAGVSNLLHRPVTSSGPNPQPETGKEPNPQPRPKPEPVPTPPKPQPVIPMQGEAAAAYADFSGVPIQTKNMSVTPSSNFVSNANHQFGGSWRIAAQGSGFSATLNAPRGGKYALVVAHLSSLWDSPFGGCRGNGYSPVTITLNSATVAGDYDAAENHGGSHAMVTDRWVISTHAGKNVLRWTLGAGCTQYWIHRIELQSIDAPD